MGMRYPHLQPRKTLALSCPASCLSCLSCSAVHLAVCSSLPFLRSHQHSDDWFDLAPADVCGALPGIRAALPPQGTQRQQCLSPGKVSRISVLAGRWERHATMQQHLILVAVKCTAVIHYTPVTGGHGCSMMEMERLSGPTDCKFICMNCGATNVSGRTEHAQHDGLTDPTWSSEALRTVSPCACLSQRLNDPCCSESLQHFLVTS